MSKPVKKGRGGTARAASRRRPVARNRREAALRKLAGAEAAHHLSLLRATIESAAHGILVVDLEGRIVLFNQKFALMWGLPADVLASRDNQQALDFVLGQLKDPDQFVSRARESFERPEVDGFDVLEFLDGRVFERWITPQRIGNRIIGRVATFRDVTSQQRAEATIRRMALALRSIGDGVLMTDREHRITFVNPALLAMYGYTEQELLGQPVALLRGGDAEASLEEVAAGAISSGWRGELINRRKDGSEFLVSLVSSALHSVAGEVEGFITAAVDITGRRRAEDRLRQSEELNRRILDSMPGGVLHVRMDGSVAQANGEAQRLLGLRADPATGTFSTDWNHRAVGEDSRAFTPEDYPIQRCLRTGDPQPPTTIGVRDAHGEWAWLIFTALPLRDPLTGAQAGAVVTFVDITGRARAEERLNEAERRFRRLVETVKAVVWTANPETFQFSYVNPEAEKVLGYPARQWTEEPKFWLNHLHPDDAAWAPGFCIAATRDARDHEFEYRMIAADGRVVWLQDLITFVTRPDGTREMVGVMVDITERKQAGAALHESEERFRQVAENLQDVLWVVDAAVQRILYINPAYERIWGQSCESLCERMESFMDPVLAEDRPTVERMLAGQRRGEFKSTEYRIRRPDGSVRWIRDRSFPVRNAAGELRRIAGIAEDITERRQTEERIRTLNEELEQRIAARTHELKEANEELEAFSYSVAHDLRSPLRAMQGFAQALVEDYAPKLDATARQYASNISRAARHMDDLIADLFAYSRVGRGGVVLQPVRLDLAVAEARLQVADAIRASHAEVLVESPLPAVQSHPAILPQIIANLLGNGVKFVAAGVQPRVVVSAESRNGCVRLSVQDNGIGIAPEHQARLFQVFERLHSQEEFPGTGIGLAIVRRAMERMGGRYGVESAPGRGSRFWLELQAAEVETT